MIAQQTDRQHTKSRSDGPDATDQLLDSGEHPFDNSQTAAGLWHFEQYGDTDDPTEGYYTRSIGPLELVVEPAQREAIVSILDPDFMLIRTGLASLEAAKDTACDLLAGVLAEWQRELAQLKAGQHGD